MANYTVQNYGYVDNPLNIKKLVLDDLRRYGVFIHLRDSGKVGYNLESYLHNNSPYGINYYRNEIQRMAKTISQHEDELRKLKSDGKILYQEFVDNADKEFRRKQEEIQTGKDVPYYNTKITKLKNRAFQLRKFVESYKGPKELQAEIISDIKEMIEALENEASEYEEEAKKEIESRDKLMHSSLPEVPPYEEWLKDETDDIKYRIEFCKDRIKESKQKIEQLRKNDELIEELFYSLAPYDEDLM